MSDKLETFIHIHFDGGDNVAVNHMQSHAVFGFTDRWTEMPEREAKAQEKPDA